MVFGSAVLCLAIGSLIGGATGFGTALIATPLMLLTGLSMPVVVVVNLFAGLLTRVGVAVKLRAHVEWREVGLLCIGSIPGACIGAATVGMLPLNYLKPIAGVVIALCGLCMTLPSGTVPRPFAGHTFAMAGAIGGFLSTTTSLNGPPPVLLLTRAGHSPMPFMANLAGYFIVTNALSLGVLWLSTGLPTNMPWHWLPLFAVAAVVGNRGGLAIAERMDAARFRSVVIAMVILAGVCTTITALLRP